MEPPFTELPVTHQQTFTAFYDIYAPKLWGLISGANLPVYQSEIILIETFTKAWQQVDRSTLTEKQMFIRLMGLASREGLPVTYLQSVFKAVL